MNERIIDNSKFLASLKSDVPPPRYPKLDAQIRKHIQEKGKLETNLGIYGDFMGAGAYVEDIILNEDGINTKYFGCPYLYKGKLEKETLDRVNIMKRLFISTVRLVSKKPFIYFLPLYLLFKKSIIKEVIYWIGYNYMSDLFKYKPKINENYYDSKYENSRYDAYFCPAVRELIRVGKTFTESITDPDYKEKTINVVYCVAMFPQNDNAYRIIFQDVFGQARNIMEALAILIERQKAGNARIEHKWEAIEKLIKWAMFFSKDVRWFFEEFFKRLDKNKVAMDSSDRFFAINRRGYQVSGIPFSVRLKEWERIVKEEGIIILGI